MSETGALDVSKLELDAKVEDELGMTEDDISDDKIDASTDELNGKVEEEESVLSLEIIDESKLDISEIKEDSETSILDSLKNDDDEPKGTSQAESIKDNKIIEIV